jgi:hypothetical protein
VACMCTLTQRSNIFAHKMMFICQITEGRLATGPLTASLYGEISPAAPKGIRLEAPSPSHILPFKLPGQDIPRFSSFTFRCLESGIQQQSPLSKRPKTVLDEAWHSAVDLAHEVDASLNDGLPSNLSSYRVDTVRIHKEKVGVGTLTSDDSEAKPSTSSPKTSSGLLPKLFARQNLFSSML